MAEAMIDAPGIYRMTLDEYLADPCPEPSLHATVIHTLSEQAPLHGWARHPRLNPAYVREISSAFDLGTAFHAMLLEGADVFDVVDAPDWKKKAAQQQRAAIRKAGKTPLLIGQRAQLGRMQAAVLRALGDYPGSPAPFTRGEPERTVIWREPNGVWCRTRPDWLTGDGRHVWDLKTTSGSAHPFEWTRALFTHGVDIQAAMAQRGVRAVLGVTPAVRFVVVETEPPHGVSILSLDAEAEEYARAKVSDAIETWGTCLASGKWPGYTLRTIAAEVPPWLKVKWMLRQYTQ